MLILCVLRIAVLRSCSLPRNNSEDIFKCVWMGGWGRKRGSVHGCQWGSEHRRGAYHTSINTARKHAHAVKAPAPIYLQTEHRHVQQITAQIPHTEGLSGWRPLAPSRSTLHKPKATLPENPRGPPSWEPGRGGGRYADEVRTQTGI